ncbi:uncharacterized protein TRIADDRAFT_60107 [Trichoplax adhaerens]|uniref:AAA+ ATPase domain-containing protein n=1 Tax=Trichoplax adhaerens TaxID=10228 RepID=B3S7B6_TRIAD|nr:hypothetical protein TRIADDRAFT_60107 [Trichoplax adhaerens]EDV21537.1 hypothetical protein TRIADDRAFT_60107 [Trichoplax adhaerens]|eukprot:XP_002116137.1 hypothetical protein TRIADDRAFT_60107 [Trichoplax adhaerens]
MSMNFACKLARNTDRLIGRLIFVLRQRSKQTNPVIKTVDGWRSRIKYSYGLPSISACSFPARTVPWLSTAALGLFLLTVNDGDQLSIIPCSKTDSGEIIKLCYAAKVNDITILKRLIQNGTDVNQRHPLGWTALQCATANGCQEAVKVLLDAGADVDAGDFYSTPFRIAQQKGIDVYSVIQKREAEFNSSLRPNYDCRGFTALHYAVLFRKTQIIEILLEAGAAPNLKSQMGHLPVEYTDDEEIIETLKNAEVKYRAQKLKEAAVERKRYPLEKRIKEQIIGQELPIAAVASAIRRKENGWHNEDRPMVFLFLGSSGIGKTELAKQVAKYIHKDLENVAKMIGSPPGYIGHDEGGQLTKRLKKCSNAVVLLDEVDKAHPDVLTILLQLFDEGRLTDGKGKTIDCKDAIFIMTCNLGNAEIANYAMELRKKAKELAIERKKSDAEISDLEDKITLSKSFCDKVIKPILKSHFRRDEFLGRINEILYFLPFSRSELLLLVNKELCYWSKIAKHRHNINLTWDKEVLEVIADGYDVYYGARSIKYETEKRIINQLAAAHERDLIQPNCDIHVAVTHNKKNQEQKITLEMLKEGNRKEHIKLEDSDTQLTTAASLLR